MEQWSLEGVGCYSKICMVDPIIPFATALFQTLFVGCSDMLISNIGS